MPPKRGFRNQEVYHQEYKRVFTSIENRKGYNPFHRGPLILLHIGILGANQVPPKSKGGFQNQEVYYQKCKRAQPSRQGGDIAFPKGGTIGVHRGSESVSGVPNSKRILRIRKFE